MSENRIPTHTAVFMLGTALFYDAVQFLLGLMFIGLVLNWGITAIAWFHFYLWCKLRGVSFISPKGAKRGLLLGGAGLAEMIPGFNMLPMWTVTVAIIILSTQKEDRKTNALRKKEKEEASRMRVSPGSTRGERVVL